MCLAESGKPMSLTTRPLEEVSQCQSWTAAIQDLAERIAPPSGASSLYPSFVPRTKGGQFQFTRNDLAQLLTAYFAAIASNRSSPEKAAAIFRKLPTIAPGRLTYAEVIRGFQVLHLFQADRDHDGRLRDREIHALVSGCPDLSFASGQALASVGLAGRQQAERSSFEAFVASHGIGAPMPAPQFQGLMATGSSRSRRSTRATTSFDGGVAACKGNSDFPDARAYLSSLSNTRLQRTYSEGVLVDDDPKLLGALLHSLGRFPARAPGATFRDYVIAYANKESWRLNEWSKRNAVDPDGADGQTISLNSLALFLQSHEDLTANASILGAGTLTGRGTLLRGKRIRTGDKITRYRGVSSTVLRTAKDLEGKDADSPAFAHLSRIGGSSTKREHSFALSLDFFGQKDVTDDPRWRIGWMAQRLDPTGTFTKRFTYLIQRRILPAAASWRRASRGATAASASSTGWWRSRVAVVGGARAVWAGA